MLVEFAMIPLGIGESLAAPLAQVLDIVDKSSLPYKLTPSGTCMEGEWDEVMEVIKTCHNHLRAHSKHIVTTVRIQDEVGETNQINRNITAIEEQLGRKLKH